MRLSIASRPARFAALAAVAARLFLGLTVDAPLTHNGAWLSALIGGLLAMPWAFCVCRFKPRGKALPALLAILSILDAAGVLSAVTRSAGYLALDRSPALALLLPTGIAALWCVWRNGDAVGYGAMLWVRIATALLLVVALLQWRYYRPAWLCPILGSGWTAILEGGIRSAGWITSASAVLLLPEEQDRLTASAALVPIAAEISAVLIALQQMMAPTFLSSGGWLDRLDALLCNGRAPLYLQLPMIVFWFAGLFHLVLCELFAGTALTQRVFMRMDGRIGALSVVAAALALSRLEALPAWMDAVAPWAFPAAGALTAATMLLKGGRSPCVSDA